MDIAGGFGRRFFGEAFGRSAANAGTLADRLKASARTEIQRLRWRYFMDSLY
jgi:hypothetical protein